MRTGAFAALAACVFLAIAAPAFAYPNPLAQYPEGVARSQCTDCHGIPGNAITQPGDDEDLLASVRKGPHGGYTSASTKCQVRHVVHNAPKGGVKLLPGPTIRDTCESCHDGTGGTAVYGVIKARTGEEPAAIHRIDATSTIPGGASDGSSSTGLFSGPDGTMTCTDCHSPHDSDTVQPFTGDRLRSAQTSDTAYATKTNRLLKQAPGGAETTVAVYGAGWCASCHAGRATGHTDESGLMREHPVMQDDEYSYDALPVVTGVGSYETTIGSLGQSNRGYVMPDDPEAQSRQKTELQLGRGALCQQCHEDERDVGPAVRKTNPTIQDIDQEFRVSAYGADADPFDNPRFQAFPHESGASGFLVRRPSPTEPYQLCLNCHDLLHEVPEAYAECVACHRAGDAADIHDATEAGCSACHTAAMLSMDCGSCHPDELEPHGYELDDHAATPGSGWVTLFAAETHEPSLTDGDLEVLVDCALCHSTDIGPLHGDRCATCHPSPRDSFTAWTGDCQQGACHVTYHDGAVAAHALTDDPASPPYYGNCDNCHNNPTWEVQQAACLNCHAAYDPVNTTPPLTTSNAIPVYVGPAKIAFSITKAGKVAVGTTFHRLDGGPATPVSTLMVSSPGSHSLEFWSVDQTGTAEASVNSASFTILADTMPPVTTSNAQPLYYTATTIVLSATDASTLGVRTTYYRVNGGPVQTGTRIPIPAPASGTTAYTIEFWSEDWSGNVETPTTASFTVAGGTGTIRLVWGDSDLSGPPGPGSEAAWTIRRDSWTGAVVASGGGAYPGWSGFDDVVVPVRPQPYYAIVDWWDDTGGYWDQSWFGPIYILTHGQTERFSY